jgi:hypothetical protein
VTTANLFSFDESYRADIWRLTCAVATDKVALLVRITPTNNSTPFICGADFTIIQAATELEVTLRKSASGTPFCTYLLSPTTFSLEGAPPFDNTGAFTLDADQGSHPVKHVQVAVPAWNLPPALTLTVVSTGCNLCAGGQLAQVHVHVVNPGAPFSADLRAGAHLPDGGAAPIADIPVVISTGEQDIPLFAVTVPANLASGSYAIEAALIDPIFAVTLARHRLSLTKQ